MEGELEVMDDLIDDLMVFDKGDDMHLASASRTEQRIDLVDFLYHFGPAFGGKISLLFLYDGGMGGINSRLAHLASVGIRVETIVANHYLALVWNMARNRLSNLMQ